MKPTTTKAGSGSMSIQEFSCAEGVGVTVREGGINRGTARMSDEQARQFATNLVTRLGGVAIFGDPKES